MIVTVFGLGKLGLPLAISLARGGNKVVGVDKSNSLLESLRHGEVNSQERDLQSQFNNFKSNFILFTSDYNQALSQSSTSIIIVNSQLGADGYSSKVVEECISEIAKTIKAKGIFQNIVLSSTVLPGTSQRLVSIIESFQLVVDKDFSFSYVPDFIKLGSALDDFANPDFVLVGSNSETAFQNSLKLWSSFVTFDTKFRQTSLEEAEIVKICLNAYLVSKISFANFVNLALQNRSELNAKNILEIVGLDRRIGGSFFKPGAPYGGTCFPRDAIAFQVWAERMGLTAKHIAFAEELNKQYEEVLAIELLKYDSVAILGFTFKEGSQVTQGSPSFQIASKICGQVTNLKIYDHFYTTFPSDILEKFNFVSGVDEAVAGAEVILIMHNDKSLVPKGNLYARVLDPWDVASTEDT